ncbi:MAG: hypothetical protein HRT89_08910 [Lentisphaeria bacterium]|nr:hypothetical protein [Lentisphaeria bacterium]NQZ68178.1 hypothetical protein [Lentisphaeria bacterium]
MIDPSLMIAELKGVTPFSMTIFLFLCAAMLIYIFAKNLRRHGYKKLAKKLGLQFTDFNNNWDSHYKIFRETIVGLSRYDEVSASDIETQGDYKIYGEIDGFIVEIGDMNSYDNVIEDPKYRREGDRQVYSAGSEATVTMVILQSAGMELPEFEISPRDKIRDGMLGDPGMILFDTYGFSTHNRVEGECEEDVRKLLTDNVQKQLVGNEKITVEGYYDTLVLSHYKESMSFEEIEEAVAIGLAMMKELK